MAIRTSLRSSEHPGLADTPGGVLLSGRRRQAQLGYLSAELDRRAPRRERSGVADRRARTLRADGRPHGPARLVTYDIVVVGLGAMGSAVALQAARLGARVLGIDRSAPPHTHGSTHGDTRITRLALGEGAMYVPLAVRSQELWRELEAATGEELLRVTGGVFLSAPDGRGHHGVQDFLATTIEAARAHGVDLDELDAAGLAALLPPFALRGDER